MAASKNTLVHALLRVAKTQGNPNAWLLSIIQGNYSSATAGDGTVTIAISTGGSSSSFTLPPGMDPFSIVELAELALQNLETGIDAPVQFDACGVPLVPAITQLPNSIRTTSYGVFGGLKH